MEKAVSSRLWARVTDSAPWSRRDSMGHLVYDSKMWILGGWTPERVNDVWSSDNGRDWKQVTSLAPWSERNLPCCLVHDDKMWVMGGAGLSGGEISTYSDVWNSTDGVNWDQVTDKAAWSARSAASAVVFDGRIWIMGGMGAPEGTAHLNDVWYSSDGLDWEQATDYASWVSRAMHTSVVFDDRIWVLGGGIYDERYFKNSAIDHRDVWYSTDGSRWYETTGNAQWPPRRFHRSVVYDGKMWVLGGAHFGNRNDVWHSANGVTWDQLQVGEQWSVRHEPGCLVYDNKMWIMGGFGRDLYNDVWTLG